MFARLPELGRVKTRLAAKLGDDRTLALYEAMLRDVMRGVGTSSEQLQIEVMWAPSPDANGDRLRTAFAPHAVAMQTGETLGDRLSMAFSERFFFHRTRAIIAIGVDDPSLPRELLDRAFELLDSCEWVLGPATDGGYYLIGCRAGAFHNSVFEGIEWGTPSVLSTTLERIRALQATVAVLPVRSDIDVAEDLERYSGDGEVRRLLDEWS